MANPQKENGYTPIANELLEAIIKFPFTIGEMKVVLLILRHSYGWSRKEAQISYTGFIRQTALSRRAVQYIIKRLMVSNVINKNRGGYKQSYFYRLNKDYTQWRKYSAIANPMYKSVAKSGHIYKTIENNKDTAAAKNVAKDSAIEMYENNVGMLTSYSLEMIQDLIAQFGERWVCEAIKEAVRQNIRKLAYIDSILQRWNAEGFKSQRRSYGKHKDCHRVSFRPDKRFDEGYEGFVQR